MYFAPVGVYDGIERDLNLFVAVRPDIMSKYLSPFRGKDGFFLMPTLLLPRSVGELKLANKNPLSHPVIDPKYFSHPDDMKILIEGLPLYWTRSKIQKAHKRKI
jgi:choline dehydrogenase-like flavoprotein